MKVCILCTTEEHYKCQSSLHVVKHGAIGAIGVNRAGDACGSSFRVKVGKTVHIKCQKNYINLDRIFQKVKYHQLLYLNKLPSGQQ